MMNVQPNFLDADRSAALQDLPSILICIQGNSDDLAEVMTFRDGQEKLAHQEYRVLGHNPARFRLLQGDGIGLEVVLMMLDTGVWSAGVAQLHEDVPLPDWPISFVANDYSTIIAIGVPKMVTVELVSESG